jgi:hypothetical protein
MREPDDTRYLQRGEDEEDFFRLQVGPARWGQGDRAVSYAWRDQHGNFSRGTEIEIPEAVFPHLVAFAVKTGYLSWDALVRAASDLQQDGEEA